LESCIYDVKEQEARISQILEITRESYIKAWTDSKDISGALVKAVNEFVPLFAQLAVTSNIVFQTCQEKKGVSLRRR
jgi:hypothetical protein